MSRTIYQHFSLIQWLVNPKSNFYRDCLKPKHGGTQRSRPDAQCPIP